MHTILLCLLAIIPVETTIEERVDVVERNHYFDESGNHVFDQLIFKEWCESAGCDVCVAWRMVKQPLTHPKGRIVLIDGDKLRDIHYRSYNETWTQFDPELCEREWWPVEQRRGLKHDRN